MLSLLIEVGVRLRCWDLLVNIHFARDDFGYWFGCGIWIDVFVDRESAHDLVEISD